MSKKVKTEAQTIEEMADQFLAENDPYCRDKRAKKGRRVDYPYHTKTQLEQLRLREIPFSNLHKGQAARCLDRDCDLENYREVGNE